MSVMLVQYIAALKHGNTFSLLPKKMHKNIYFTRITGQYNATLPQTPKQVSILFSFQLEFQVSWVIYWIPGSRCTVQVLCSYSGFQALSCLTEIQVSNELLACGLCRHLEHFDLAA